MTLQKQRSHLLHPSSRAIPSTELMVISTAMSVYFHFQAVPSLISSQLVKGLSSWRNGFHNQARHIIENKYIHSVQHGHSTREIVKFALHHDNFLYCKFMVGQVCHDITRFTLFAYCYFCDISTPVQVRTSTQPSSRFFCVALPKLGAEHPLSGTMTPAACIDLCLLRQLHSSVHW